MKQGRIGSIAKYANIEITPDCYRKVHDSRKRRVRGLNANEVCLPS